MKVDKKYREAFAAFTLMKIGCIKESFSLDWLRDKPDLQIGLIGIEVTEALTKHLGGQRKVESDIHKQNTYDAAVSFISQQKNPKKIRSSPHQIPGTSRFSTVSGGGYNEERNNCLVANCVNSKSTKFLKFPSLEMYKMRGLFISADELLLPSHNLDCDLILHTVKASTFVTVFLQCNGRIYEIRKVESEIIIHNFSNSDRDAIKCDVVQVLCHEEYEVYRERYVSCYGCMPMSQTTH